jgi:hypothetical protein
MSNENEIQISDPISDPSPEPPEPPDQQQTQTSQIITANSWTPDIETFLDNMRKNCVIMYNSHRQRYLLLQHRLNYFKIPIIILSAVNSVLSVGLQPYVHQNIISGTNCILALVCGIIGSIELYLAIHKQMENENNVSIQYYLLSIDIYKTLTLAPENRKIDANAYLYKKYQIYVKLIENSYLNNKKIHDNLSTNIIPNQLIINSSPPPPQSIENIL